MEVVILFRHVRFVLVVTRFDKPPTLFIRRLCRDALGVDVMQSEQSEQSEKS